MRAASKLNRLMAALAVVVSPLPLLAAMPAAAQGGTPESFADLVDRVMPAVVNISTSQALPGSGGAVTAGPAAVSLGSGFIIDASGIVVTNNHVIDKATKITVTLESGEEYSATLRGVDRETDLAVLKINDPRKFPFVKFGNSDELRVGDWVVAIGQPFGLGGSVSAGIVSAKSRDIDSGLYDDFIQTDAAINRGNSGGPLFDMSGRVVGVNTVIFSQTGGSVGVGFAVPGNLASRVVGQLVKSGETQRGFLGVLLEDVSEDAQARLKLPNREGALVIGIPSATGPAGKAGVREDDVILRFGTRAIVESRDLTRAIAEAEVGSTVPMLVYRDGKTITLQVLIARRETVQAALRTGFETTGLTLQTPTSELRARFNVPEGVRGVVVTAVASDSPLATMVRAGDVILEVGWDEVRDADSVELLLNRHRATHAGPVQVLVRRGDRLFYAQINP